MQTAGQAFRKALETGLSSDIFLSRVLIGGVHFNNAPQLDSDGRPPKSPYAVITIPPYGSEKGNGGRDILYRPIVRIMVYGDGAGSILRSDCDACARKIDNLVKAMSETIADDSDTTDDFQVMNFYFENGVNEDQSDSAGNKYTRIGADYRAFGYYIHCT